MSSERVAVKEPLLFRLVPDEETCRTYYDEYVSDVAWYRENDELDPRNPDKGYRTGEPYTFEEYRDQYIEGLLHEVEAPFGSSFERVQQP